MSGNHSAAAGAAVYSAPVLAIYDLFVLGFSNTWAWRCPSRRILDFYNRHVSANHLDVGVGTGFYLDRCRYPEPKPAITLLDLNPNSLATAANRLQRYQPRTVQADVLEPLPLDSHRFDSIGLSYLLHCLPGSMPEKEVVFRHLQPWLNPGGVVFGATILGRGQRHNPLARTLLRVYNRRGIFGNWQDDAAGLEQILQANFGEYTLDVVGCVALFAAHPRPGSPGRSPSTGAGGDGRPDGDL